MVVKQTLKDVFVSLGFSDFSTFKQSGNVIFQTQELDSQELIRNIEAKLQPTLGYPIAVFIRSIKQLKDMLDLDPFRDQPPESTSFLVTFLPDTQVQLTCELPFIIPKSTAKVINVCGTEVFSVTHGGGEGALPNPFIESKFKVKATTRNINVIRGIVEKYG